MSAQGRFVVSARTSVLFANIAASFVGRVINLTSTLITIPLAVSALGQEQYGILAVIVSIIIFFSYADFGLGLAIINDVAAHGDVDTARQVVSQVWAFLLAAGLTVFVLGMMLLVFGVADRLLPNIPKSVLPTVWTIVVASAAVGIPFALPQRVFFALQLSVQGQMWATIGRLAVVVGAFAAYWWSRDLVTFVAVLLGLPVVISVFSAAHLFFVLRPDLRPSLQLVRSEGLLRRVTIGLQFSLLNFCNFCETGIDLLLVSFAYSATTVAHYDLLTRVYYYIPALLSIALYPLWPAIANARARGELAWSRKIERIAYIVTSLVAAVPAALLFFFSNAIVENWTGVVVPRDPLLNALAAVASVFLSVNLLQAMLLNARGIIVSQVKIIISMILLLVPLKYASVYTHNLAAIFVPLVLLYVPKLVLTNRLIIRADSVRVAPA